MIIRKVKYTEKIKLKNLYQLYLYDLSPFTGDEVNSLGLFNDDTTDLFFLEKDLKPYFIEVKNTIIGFILIQQGKWTPDISVDYYIGEFFISNPYKNKGFGIKAVKTLFTKYPGIYLVGQLTNNLPAILFWKKVYNVLNIEYQSSIEYLDDEIFNFTYQKFKI